VSNSDADEAFDTFCSADIPEQERMLSEVCNWCRAEANRDSRRLLLFSVMVEVAIVLAAEIKPSRPFRGRRA
jgi:predicted nucleic acid-binding Zn ribbon protein